jgi:hypothetical protein
MLKGKRRYALECLRLQALYAIGRPCARLGCAEAIRSDGTVLVRLDGFGIGHDFRS